jgi:hypothetical protein
MSERNTVSRTRKTYVPGRGTVYVSERVPAPPLPSLNDRPCLRIYDPVTRKEIPNTDRDPFSNEDYIIGLNTDYLYQRLKEIKEQAQISAERITLFDPCTKRKVGNIQDLEARIKEIECYKLKALGQIKPRREGELQLQLHQEVIVKGIQDTLIIDYTKNMKDNRFLIGVLPRGGKTFIAGGLMRMMRGFNGGSDDMIILWITAAPNETKMQVEKELLGKFTDFADYRFVAVRDARDVTIRPGVTVFFVSSQLLTLAKLGVARERSFLSELLNPTATSPKISMIFFDEAHKTGVGAATKTLVNELLEANKTRTMPFILLTGTYARIQEDYQISRSHTYIWDYTDVLSARNLGSDEKHDEALKTLYERFGDDLVNHVIKQRRCLGESEKDMVKSYADYPNLHFISGDFHPGFVQKMKATGFYTKDSGLNMGKILQIKEGAKLTDFKTRENKIKRNCYTQFTNLELLINLFVPTLMNDILYRINNISEQRGSRFQSNNSISDSLMMFLPTGGKGTNIFYTLCAWASLLLYMFDEVLNEKKDTPFAYEIVCVVENENLPPGAIGSDNQLNSNISSDRIHIVSKNVKETILAIYDKAIRHDRELIILAGEKMSMGVSLPFIDVVMMLNDKSAPDDIIQKMYRAVTPSFGKKDAFIVDFSPKRTLAAIFGYTKLSSHESLTPYQVFKILMNTYYWDDDMFRGPQNTLLYQNTFLSNITKLFQIVNSDKELGEGNLLPLDKRRQTHLDQELLHLLAEFRGTSSMRNGFDFSELDVQMMSRIDPSIPSLYANLEAKKTRQEAMQIHLLEKTTPIENNEYNNLRNTTDNVNVAKYRLANAIDMAKRAKPKSRTAKLTNEEKARRTAARKQQADERKAVKEAAKQAARAEALAAKEAEKRRVAEAKAAAKAAIEAAKLAERQRIAEAKAQAKAARNATRAAAKATKKSTARTSTRKTVRNNAPLPPPPRNTGGNTTENENV